MPGEAKEADMPDRRFTPKQFALCRGRNLTRKWTSAPGSTRGKNVSRPDCCQTALEANYIARG